MKKKMLRDHMKNPIKEMVTYIAHVKKPKKEKRKVLKSSYGNTKERYSRDIIYPSNK
jgi:hypothetical protein